MTMIPSPPAAAAPHPFDALTPARVLDALDAVGLRGDGRLLQLNSYENRVFLVYLETGAPIVAKFYRPARWSIEQILEEHAFALALVEAEIPVIAPLVLSVVADAAMPVALSGEPPTLTSAAFDGTAMAYAAYPCRAGPGPELDDVPTLRWLGRFIGRLHSVGARKPFAFRRNLTPQTLGYDARDRVIALDVLPPDQAGHWLSICNQALALVDQAFGRIADLRSLRLHGDCHPGNILWRPDGPQVVDLDDACNGPAIQDLWMLLSGDAAAMSAQMAQLLIGYRAFMLFDDRELALIEPLRTLRMIHHSAWLAERWSDPAFPVAFPWFGQPVYWATQTQQLREQIDAMAQPPIAAPAFSFDDE
jgi:Ser/Thr protein kinase RdoA (MazF antagonist)